MENTQAASLAMRRIMKEYKDLKAKKQVFVYAQPLENEPFQWHFTIRGPSKTDFEGGIYHGLVSLPYDYPMKPPYIMFYTVSKVIPPICTEFTCNDCAAFRQIRVEREDLPLIHKLSPRVLATSLDK